MLRFDQNIVSNKVVKTVPWVEKYRPKSIEEVVHQEEVIQTLRSSIDTGNLPHLLFYGPPGTGKTSTILALARQIYGVENMKDRVLELNASDERGIDVIRKRVKSFASQAVKQNIVINGKTCPPYKLIILDEADAMTKDAQNALRRVMEIYSHVTRFCIICNYVSRIIQPISSRTAKFRFKPLKAESFIDRLKFICEKEEISVNQDILDELYKISSGDMRKGITYLQSSYNLYGNNLTVDKIQYIAGIIPNHIIEQLYEKCKNSPFKEMQQFVGEIVADGYDVSQILSQFNEFIVFNNLIDDRKKAQILSIAGQSDNDLIEGGDEYLQLLNLAAQTMRILNE